MINAFLHHRLIAEYSHRNRNEIGTLVKNAIVAALVVRMWPIELRVRAAQHFIRDSAESETYE